MTRMRLVVLAVIIVGLTCWLTLRKDKSALASTERPRVETAFMENTEEVAFKRWQTSQARHWRHLVVQK